MKSPKSDERYQQLISILDNYHPIDWGDIVDLLKLIKDKKKTSLHESDDFLQIFARGTAFITFGYGIDGVSIEMSKYAHSLEALYSPQGNSSIHFIGGNFHPQTSSILNPEWKRFHLKGIDGWDKWADGEWFDGLFRRKMTSFSVESNVLTQEIFRQAVNIAKELGKYFIENNISLSIPVNIASNPGNIALTLGLVLVTEIFGTFVLNSNHDFYWEAGKPLTEREPGEEPGVRDHFFHNINNKTFFALFEMLYPWNGRRWLQININARQSRKLIEIFGIPKEKVFKISTSIADSFFEAYSRQDVFETRLRMGHILSGGEAVMHPVSIANHLSAVDDWMMNQQPIIIGAKPGLTVDPTSEDLFILLQPTRIVSRKRVERNLELVGELFQNTKLREKFDGSLNCQLILHITGPTPQEHQRDLERVLWAYNELTNELPGSLADRIFIAFSVGHESHPSFLINNFQPLNIESIYRMADMVVFPSETEGRGLPIIEAGASGVPIICSQYYPREVFRDVIGEDLPENMRIKYTLYPEGTFPQEFLNQAADLLLNPGANQALIDHNKEAVRTRFSQISLTRKFARLLDQLHNLE